MMSTMKEDEQVIKNFGFNRFADKGDDDSSDEEEQDREMGIGEAGLFDGDPDKEKEEYKRRFLDMLYG